MSVCIELPTANLLSICPSPVSSRVLLSERCSIPLWRQRLPIYVPCRPRAGAALDNCTAFRPRLTPLSGGVQLSFRLLPRLPSSPSSPSPWVPTPFQCALYLSIWPGALHRVVGCHHHDYCRCPYGGCSSIKSIPPPKSQLRQTWTAWLAHFWPVPAYQPYHSRYLAASPFLSFSPVVRLELQCPSASYAARFAASALQRPSHGIHQGFLLSSCFAALELHMLTYNTTVSSTSPGGQWGFHHF